MSDNQQRYALHLDVNGRIQSATSDTYGASNDVRVDVLPEGDITDYRYVNGEYVYDPWERPVDDQIDPIILLTQQISALAEDITNTQLALCDVYEMMEG